MVKNYTTIHLWLHYLGELEVVILLITYKVCVPNKTEDLKIHIFNIKGGKNRIQNFNKKYIMRM